MNEYDTLETKLAASRPTLSPEAKAALFQRIEAAAVPGSVLPGAPASVASPYLAFLKRPVALVLVVLLSVTTLTTAAQAAKPGDMLFPVEQLSEELRYLVTPASFRGELRTAYAEQRLYELKRIAAAGAVDTDVIQETERLSLAVAILLAELDALENDTAREAVAAELLASLNPQTLRARIQNDRFELRDDNVRIRFKDGEWRYRYDNHREDDDHDGEDDDDDDRDDDFSASDRDDDRDDNDFRWRVTDTPHSDADDLPSDDSDDDGNNRDDSDDDHDDEDDDDDERDGDSSGSDRDDRDDDRDEDGGDGDRRDDTTPEDRDADEDDAAGDDHDDRDDDEDKDDGRI